MQLSKQLLVARNPWRSLACSHITPISALLTSVCVCVFKRTLVLGFMDLLPILNQYDFILISLNLQRPYLHIISHSEVLGGREFWEDTTLSILQSLLLPKSHYPVTVWLYPSRPQKAKTTLHVPTFLTTVSCLSSLFSSRSAH